MDGRVIDIPIVSRWLLVNGIIAPFRAPKSASVYKKVWMQEGSPLKVFGRQLEKSIQDLLGSDFVVRLAMRYQSPSIDNGIEELIQSEVSHILALPLFPQYASATTGSVYEEVMRILSKKQTIPSLTFAGTFFNAPFFTQPIAKAIEKARQSRRYDKVLFTYHGLPERQIRKGDRSDKCLSTVCCDSICARNRLCYRAQCFETSRILAKISGLSDSEYETTFQSRLGKDPWIKPYTDDVIKRWANAGVKSVLALSPSFVADCLETTEEIGEEYRNLFLENGGKQWDLIPCLNNDPEWAKGLADWVRQLVILQGQNIPDGHQG